jgi:hypothetical protein
MAFDSRIGILFLKSDQGCEKMNPWSGKSSKRIRGPQLGIVHERLERTVSHRIWLEGDSHFVEEGGRTVVLIVKTVRYFCAEGYENAKS